MKLHGPPRYPLDRPLPVEIRGIHNVFTRYKDYPVFSWPWWWRRMWIFLPFMVAVFFGITFKRYWVVTDFKAATLIALYTFTSAMLLTNLAPGLAACVRSRRLSSEREKIAVVLVVLAGFGFWFLANKGLSSLCDQIASHYDKAREMTAKNSVDKQAWSLPSLIIVGLFSGLWALPGYFIELRRWLAYSSAREAAGLELLKHQAELRLSVLQAQVEPHFLFNTLASVRAMVRLDPSQSEATLDALVDYLRASIPRLRDEETTVAPTLGEQLDLCASYLEVMRLRTAGRLQYAINVDAGIRTMHFPSMLLITLVENAIKHGIEPKRGPGRVSISVMCDSDTMRVSVVDDGMGLQPGVGSGLGLANVRAQLETLFGSRAGFDLRSVPVQGACAELWIPVNGGVT